MILGIYALPTQRDLRSVDYNVVSALPGLRSCFYSIGFYECQTSVGSVGVRSLGTLLHWGDI